MTTEHKSDTEGGPVVYLAGPDVFLARSSEIGAEKKRICAELGLTAVYPGDTDLLARSDLSPTALAAAIYEENVAHIRHAQGVLANLTPFRGPNADDGTAFEVGYAVALGLPVVAYDAGGGDLRAKTERFRAAATEDPFEIIEDFGEAANLMLACSVDGPIEAGADSLGVDDLTRFAAAALRMAKRLSARP